MVQIKIDIKNCKQCPYWRSERVYTGDSFELIFDWVCSKAKKKIEGYVEPRDINSVKIPEWCPAK